MKTEIAGLITEVPEAGGLATRCEEYLYSGERGVDVIIHTNLYRRDKFAEGVSEEIIAYMESGRQFYVELLKYGGLMLHASAVELDGRAYLFSAPCGTGKSTHTSIWQKTFGEAVHVFNDDKPALRCVDGKWFAYGTPWSGKNSINMNLEAPVAGICFLKQAKENKIRRMTSREAVENILSQTVRRNLKSAQIIALMDLLDDLVRKIPVYELENRPEADAARLSYETMRRGAEELGL